MNIFEKIDRRRELRLEVSAIDAEIEKVQRACTHDWGDPVADHTEEPDFAFSHFEPCGSDPIPQYKPSGTKITRQWKRMCAKCGKTEYTENTKPAGEVPAF